MEGTAGAQVVAEWRFEPNAFLADSSGNGHTLVNGVVIREDGASSAEGLAARPGQLVRG